MERDLVERAIAGDHDAFSELARVSIGRLYVVARLILRDAGSRKARPFRDPRFSGMTRQIDFARLPSKYNENVPRED